MGAAAGGGAAAVAGGAAGRAAEGGGGVFGAGARRGALAGGTAAGGFTTGCFRVVLFSHSWRRLAIASRSPESHSKRVFQSVEKRGSSSASGSSAWATRRRIPEPEVT